MPKRRSQNSNTGDDFRAARARLKDISAGLGGLFDTVTSLIEDAARQGEATTSGKRKTSQRMTTDFDVRIRTLDELAAAKGRANPAATPRPKPQKAKPVAPPRGAEQHEFKNGVLVIVTLGEAEADSIRVEKTATGLSLRAGDWHHAIETAQLLERTPIERTVRNGYLTLRFAPSAQSTPDN